MSLFYSQRRAEVQEQVSQPHPSSSEIPSLPPQRRPLARSHRHGLIWSQQSRLPNHSDQVREDDGSTASTSAASTHPLARAITTLTPPTPSSSLSPLRQTRFYHRGRSISIHSPNEEDDDHAGTSSPHFPSFAAHTSLPSSATDKNSALARALDIQRGTTDFDGKEAIDSSLRERSDIEQRVKQARVEESGGDGHEDGQDDEPEESAVSGAYLISYFVAGGAAGAASRTVVSPLERLKIIMQVQPSSAGKGKAAYNGVVSGLVKMWQEEGFAGYMRGNGINCLRIVPYSAVQFCTYEIAKDKLSHGGEGEMTTAKRLLAGAMAGTASCVATFPLDLVRARISIASASLYADAKAEVLNNNNASGPDAGGKPSAAAAAPPPPSAPPKLSRSEMRAVIAERQKRVPGIWAMTAKVYREEGGIRGLYRGCIPTAAGVAPYVAINFAAYEAMRKYVVEASLSEGRDGEIGTGGKLLCGALAGSISQSVTFPLDVLRRRMQVAGMKDSKLGYSDKSAIDAIRNILRADGFLGLYRGLWPNLLKVAPSIGTSFLVYETVQTWVHPHKHHPHGHGNGNGHNGNGHGHGHGHDSGDEEAEGEGDADVEK